MYEIVLYANRKGQSQADELLDKMQPKVRAKVEKWFVKLEELGPNLPRPFADIIKNKIRELRVQFGSNEYRFLYFFFDKKIIITHGFLKKTNKIPFREIIISEKIMYEFFERYERGEIEL